ncbi:DNA polymerase Y family protein [Kitasatospora cathayae]|uniref:DNA polymerase Y family protein n=1 Tax=Kitasatospora cathayae TaxID=3004092 RepID=A0ABY7QAA3_9ACTN|nr:DNA polymerase Y family protein [Kitasatospora sp. HUAS 3-15]WBP89685.1 DNA polymerase Y family protein [Kitasatospora sp. HUAS 3-15]
MPTTPTTPPPPATPGDDRTPRVLVVWCPDWPVVAVTGDDPVAVTEGGRILACSAGARAAGVRQGQRLKLAQRLCPELELRDRDPEAEARRFEPVVAAVEAFTPRVEVIRPGLCAIPVKGPGCYFGGEEALAALVGTAVTDALGRPPVPDAVPGAVTAPGAESGTEPPTTPHAQIGVADGLFAAVLAARAGVLVPAGRTAEFLAPYPVGTLGDEALAELLGRLGLPTVGAFAALPPEAVADRFGPAGTVAHRLARGLQPRPLVPRDEEPDLAVEQRFDPPEPLTEPLVFVARTLAEQLHQRLAGAGLTCRRVAVEVACADGRTASRLWRHEGRLSATALAERVRWQLQAWQGMGTFAGGQQSQQSQQSRQSQYGQHGFTLLRLAPDGLSPDQGRQLALWGQAVADDRVERAVARVQAVLGHAGLRRIEPAGGRGPGEQQVRVPWGEPYEAAAPADAPWPGRLAERSADLWPAVVLREPAPVRVLDEDGRPVTVDGRAGVSARPALVVVRGREERVAGWTGPWPAVEYWWDQSLARRRARFQMVVDGGRALLLTVEGGAWYLEAGYD